MKKIQLRAYRTLVKIRTLRQKGLDKVREDIQMELTRLIELGDGAGAELAAADARVVSQINLIDRLMQSGNRFQIQEYLAQQDYRTTLEAHSAAARCNKEQADAAVGQQEDSLRAARAACATNTRQRERLEEKIRLILLELAIKIMDDEDDETEESVVMRKLIQIKSVADADGRRDHA